MKQTEFDRFADEYKAILNSAVSISGEGAEYFHEYKIKDTFIRSKNYNLNVQKILDYGCGVGNSIPYYNKYFPEAKVVGLDVSQKSIDIGNSRFARLASFLLFDGKQIPFESDTFDLVQMNCVLHHIEPQYHTNTFKEILRCLKPGGIFVVFEHNSYNPITRKIVKDCPFDENAILVRSHDLLKNLKNVGYSNLKSEYKLFFPQLFSFFRPLEKFLISLPIGAQYCVVASKKV